MKEITIHSKLYDYKVEFIENVKQKMSEFPDSTIYVIDSNIFELYQKEFVNIDRSKLYIIVANEANKTMDTVMDLVSFLKKINMKKNHKIVCVGGGITQDITTFASNIFLRNVEWYFFPTTLLAMCDSCIGGKCGINLGEYKNQLGVFYPPHRIYICTDFLKTLSDEDYLNGWGELLKFSLTENADFYREIEHEQQYIPCININHYLYEGLMVKKRIIELDEFEGDLRRVLNYGHTFGHALEAYTSNVIPHGKAVIWGIDVVNYISYRNGLLSKEEYLRVKKCIKDAFLNHEIVILDRKKIFDIIKTDKKVKDNTIFFALLDKISHLVIYPMEIDLKLETLFYNYLEETHEFYIN